MRQELREMRGDIDELLKVAALQAAARAGKASAPPELEAAARTGVPGGQALHIAADDVILVFGDRDLSSDEDADPDRMWGSARRHGRAS